ncbi:MAG: phage tail protein [Sphingomonas sp.]|jgi:microcystin-dependent protein|uniref:phage tail protein n=1 Tax=Sphingomonas sp. TaxID=28214 RepID=UPI003564785F
MSVIGSITMWGGSATTVPAGWLICDGSTLDQAGKYADLFTAIGTNFGAAPPEGKFYLPDLRGRFIRGVDEGAGRDPDSATRTDMQNVALISDTVGSIQDHAFQNHTHPYQMATKDTGSEGAMGSDWEWGSNDTDEVGSASNTSTETRPLNAYLYFIIKYA